MRARPEVLGERDPEELGWRGTGGARAGVVGGRDFSHGRALLTRGPGRRPRHVV